MAAAILKMLYKTLGNSGVKVSAIGQGTIGAGSRESATPEKIRARIEVLHAGLDEGITFIDTGEDYEDGHAEEVLGTALKGIRDRVFLSSKFRSENNSSAEVAKAAERSLKRLGTDYLDLYQLHWPNPQIPLAETLEAMSALVRLGKVRFIGVSNLTYPQLKEARELSGSRVVSMQTEYNLANRGIEKECLPFCTDNGMSILAYSPLRWNHGLNDRERGLLERLCAKYAVNRNQIFLNWLIAHPAVIALTQTMSLTHIRENARAADFSMTPEDLRELGDVFLREPVPVPTGRIRVLNEDVDETHRIYVTLEDALANTLDMHPSPADIAGELKQGSLLRPVELVKTGDPSGRYDYDLTHGRMRYWAWIIAFGHEAPIPAYIKR